MVPCLVYVVVYLNDIFLLALDEVLQVFEVLLTDVAVAVRLEGFQGLVLQSCRDAVDLSALRGIVRELLPEDLLVALYCAIVGCQSFVLCDLLPSSLDVGHFVGVEGVDIALDHGGDGGPGDDLSFVGLGASVAKNQVADVVDAFDELPPQGVVGDVVQSL